MGLKVLGHRSGAKSAQTRPRKVQSGVTEVPTWIPGGSKMEPNGPRWRPGRDQMPRQGPQRSTSAAWSPPSRRQDASQSAQGRLVHGFASDFRTQRAPKGVPNRTKKRTKSETENAFVSDHVSGPIFIDLGVQKASLLGHENDPKHMHR